MNWGVVLLMGLSYTVGGMVGYWLMRRRGR